MRHLHTRATKFFEKLDIMVARYTQRCTCIMHLHNKAKHLDVFGTSQVDASSTAAPLEGRKAFFVGDLCDSLIIHYVLDDGKLVVAHAGLKEKYQGRGSGKVRDFCLYGETTGETDEYGLPVRLRWAEEYRGRAKVVYGHVPSAEVQSLNNTYCIDTGCVFGGKLTAYRYPENAFVQVPARKQYYAPVKPLSLAAGMV